MLEALAEAARLDGDPVRGAELLGAADRIREEIGAPVPACERADAEATRRALRAQLDAAVRQLGGTGTGTGGAAGGGFALAHRYGREAPLDVVLAGGAGRDRRPAP
ncbi:hypothetical protein [Plantactinospora veratri]